MAIAVPHLKPIVAPPRWAKDDLWRKAQLVPSLDLNFAATKSLVDATTGAELVTFTRASSGTYVDSQGVIQIAANDEPRFDHDPTTGESLGLLVEEQRTNGIRNNTMVGAVAGTPGTLGTNWQSATPVSELNREIVGVGVANGISYIDLRYSGTVAAVRTVTIFPDTEFTSAANNQSWAGSVYLALVGGSMANITLVKPATSAFSSVPATIGSLGFLDLQGVLSSSLLRYEWSGSTPATDTASVRMSIAIQTAASGAVDFTLRIGMPQLEQGEFATSVIPTSGTAATRAADVASITGTNFSSWYRQDEGTVFGEGALLATAAGPVFVMRGPTSNDRHQVSLSTAAIVTNSVLQASLGDTYTAQTKSSFAYALNDAAFVTNLTALQTDTSCLIPTGVVAATIGRFDFGGTQSHNGHIRRLTYWPTRLGNEVLQTITQ